MDEELKALLDVYNHHLSSNLNMWSLYIAVSFGLVGFVNSQIKITLESLIALSIIYVIYASVSARALYGIQTTIYDTFQSIRNMLEQSQACKYLRDSLRRKWSHKPSRLLALHIFMDVAVLGAMWVPFIVR